MAHFLPILGICCHADQLFSVHESHCPVSLRHRSQALKPVTSSLDDDLIGKWAQRLLKWLAESSRFSIDSAIREELT